MDRRKFLFQLRDRDASESGRLNSIRNNRGWKLVRLHLREEFAIDVKAETGYPNLSGAVKISPDQEVVRNRTDAQGDRVFLPIGGASQLAPRRVSGLDRAAVLVLMHPESRPAGDFLGAEESA